MYFMYVDESGDPGAVNSPTKYFILSAIIVHETRWLQLLNELITFRRKLKSQKGLMMKEEIHAAEFVARRIKTSRNISPSNRIDILRLCLEWLSTRDYLRVISVRIDKSKNSDPFEKAWITILQRFENTLKYQNYPDSAFKTDAGIVIADDTDIIKLRSLLRKMRRVNHIPNMGSGGARNLPVKFILKDPVFRPSKHSYFIQMVDVVAYFVKQYYDPNKAIRKKSAKNWYGKLTPIICKKATYNTSNFRIIQI